ncbi:MAG: carboxylesterase family protein, partial [Solobacterium sp.]|nr:carboxylesterase family protein [Solobacterium sp.]
LNRLAAENNIPVYEYYFDRDNGRLGSWHSGEEVYCYDNIPAGSRLYDETDRQLAKIMSGYWADFAKSGDPNREGLPVWKENMDSRSLLKLSAETEMMTEPYLPLYEVLDRMYGWK